MSMTPSTERRSAEQTTVDAGQYLSFILGGESYGIDILTVQEIRGWEQVRPLPDTPDYVKGVLDLRGCIVPIIDLRIRFRLPDVDYTRTTVIIVLAVEYQGKQHSMGVVVDGVSDVLDVEKKNIKLPPNMGVKNNTRFISGLVSTDERMLVLLDISRLLDPEEVALLNAVS